MEKLTIKYRCQHISCRNPKCYEGTLSLVKNTFVLLKDSEKQSDLMRAPTGLCKLGTSPTFQILSQQERVEEESSPQKEGSDPVKWTTQQIELLKPKIIKVKELYDVFVKQVDEQKEKLETQIFELKKQLDTLEQLSHPSKKKGKK